MLIHPAQIFPIFSCTKVVTGIACMQAVEQGLMDLDEPVGRLVPELADPKIVVDSTATTMELRKAE
jgi:CubicO group peptidase (beta-lactamase class C family)